MQRKQRLVVVDAQKARMRSDVSLNKMANHRDLVGRIERGR